MIAAKELPPQFDSYSAHDRSLIQAALPEFVYKSTKFTLHEYRDEDNRLVGVNLRQSFI